jgi:hypothetical protein
MASKVPAPYRASDSRRISAVDETFVMESMIRLFNSFNRFLPHADSKLTHSENTYYHCLSLLTVVVASALVKSEKCDARVRMCVSSLQESIQQWTETIHRRLAGGSIPYRALHTCAAFHDIWHLRDTLLAVRLATNYLLGHHGRQEKQPEFKAERTSCSEVVMGLEALNNASKEALTRAGGWIQTAKENVDANLFPRRLQADGSADHLDEVFQKVELLVGLAGTAEEHARKVASSWKVHLRDWAGIQWD